MKSPVARRHLIEATGLGAAALLSGCGALAENCKSPGPDARTESEQATGETVETEYIASEEAPPEEFEYIESSDSVRYVAATRRGDPIEYDTILWDEFVGMKGEESVIDRLYEHISQGFPNEDSLSVSAGEGRFSVVDENGFPILVSLVTETEDDCVVDEPSLSLEEVRNSVPRRVVTTVSLDGHQEVLAYNVGVWKIVHERAEPA